MSSPIVFISKHKVREGKLAPLRVDYRQGATAIEADKPGTLVFLSYLDGAEGQLTTIHLFPDPEAMARHMGGAGSRAASAAEFLEFDRFEVYGTPSAEVLQLLRAAAGTGGSIEESPEFVAGYLRLGPS